MVQVIMIAVIVFAILALIYEIYQNPNFLKFKKSTKVKVSKDVIDPDTYIDDSRIRYTNKTVSNDFQVQEVEEENILDQQSTQAEKVEQIKNQESKLNEDFNDLDDMDDDLFDDLFDDFEDDYFFSESEDSTSFVPYDGVDADSLDGEAQPNDISKQIASLPTSIKAIMLSDILDKKNI